MSWASEFLGGVFGVGPDSPQNKAINAAKDQAEKQLAYFKTLFSDLQGQATKAFEGGVSTTSDIYNTATNNLARRMGSAQDSLNKLFYSQEGQFKTLLRDVQDAGRQQASQRGLIGGAQEQALLTPAITRLGESFSTQAAQAQLGLNEMGLNLGTGLDANYMGTMANLFGSRMSSLGSMAGGAMSGVNSSGSGALQGAGLYSNSFLSDALGVASGVSSLLKLFGL